MDERHEKLMAEFRAWQRVVEELKKLGVNINEQDGLNEALYIWAERRAKLPEYQVKDDKLEEI